MSDVIGPDGTVISSSQRAYAEHDAVGQQMHPMVGIILSVQPSDAKGNWTGENHPQLRGSRHECSVLAVGDLGVPDTLLHNVIIPPQGHSGIDNFEEDLPRGCSQLIDGSTYKTDFSDVDIAKLDGEWCMVSFIGGKLEYPFVSNWWPHPANVLDPATTGNVAKTNPGKPNLVQADLKKNRTRHLRRKNGVVSLINREGSVYLDTTEAGRTATMEDNKRTVTQVDKGGHIQVNVKKKAQLEINWNKKTEKGPQLGAGSTSNSPVHDPDLPHDDQPFSSSTATKRETERTFVRGGEYDFLIKSSQVNINAKTEGSNKGQATVVASDTVMLAQQASSSDKSATVTIQNGNIQVIAKDGTTIKVLDDEVQIATKGGGLIQVKGSAVTLAGKLDVSGPLAVGGAAGQPPLLGTLYMTNFGTYLTEVSKVAAVMLAQYTALDTATSSPPLTPINPAFKLMKQAWQDFVTNGISVFMPLVQAPAATNTMLAKNTTSS